MKTKHYMALLLLALGLAHAGCKKFLDVKSDAKLVVPKSLADIQGMLDDAAMMNLLATPSFGESSADDYVLSPANLDVYGDLGKEVYLWKNPYYRFGNDWARSYRCIYNANLALELIEKVDRTAGNAEAWDRVKGSALFFRAFYELLLLGEYGMAYDQSSSDRELGIVLRRTSDFNVPSVRARVSDCYKAIVDDLQASIDLLPILPVHPYRPSRVAALALLARTQLYLRDYGRALQASEAALALKSSLMDYNADPDLNSLSAAVPFKPFNKEIIFYAEISGGFSLHGQNRANIAPALYQSYHADDLRRTAYFTTDANGSRFKGNYTAQAFVQFSGLAVDELILTQAECLAWLDRETEGMQVLNGFLRKRWRAAANFVELTVQHKVEALALIRLERRKTLLMRNLRWMDIKRLNREGAGITLTKEVGGVSYTLPPNSPRYALPLPADIIEQTGMPQN